MADIQPFRAFRYDPQRVSVPQVVTQPYDKITPPYQERYLAQSPYNLVRIILGRKEAEDNAANNVYTRAATCLKDWRAEGILRQDAEPSIYAYSQRFTTPGGGAELERRGFIALGGVEDYAAGVVFRHEQTLAKPKADRLDLLRSTQAHFGQIFMLYEDGGRVQALLTTAGPPEIEVTDEYGVLHRVWRIADARVIQAVQERMRDKKLIIADGHHRYETALNYRNERRSEQGNGAAGHGKNPYEYVMMTFVDMDAPGMMILPTHRVVHSLPSFSVESFAKAAKAFFDVEEVEATSDAARCAGMLRECGRSGSCLLAVTGTRAFLLHHPNPNHAEVFAGLSIRQQSLDVVQLHKVLLEKVLGLSEESIRNQQNLSYVREMRDALAALKSGEPRADIVFLMNPCKVSQVRDIAFAGDVMPQKSTDFFPKLLSGLTVYALD